MDRTHVTSFLTVTSLLISTAIAGVPYGPPAPPPPAPNCYPKTVFVAVPTRIFKTELVPTRVDLDQVETVYQDVLLTSYWPEPVTTTVHEPVIDYVTNLKYVTVTKPVPVVATIDSNVPAIVTVTDVSKIVKFVIKTKIVLKTDVVPVYTTRYDVVYNRIYNTKVVPVFETIHDTKIVHSTLCPQLYY